MTTNLPDGLVAVDSLSSDGGLVYEFYEDPENPGTSNICEFYVRTDGLVEIASGGAPGVPVEVFRFIADEGDRLKGRS